MSINVRIIIDLNTQNLMDIEACVENYQNGAESDDGEMLTPIWKSGGEKN